MTYSSVSFQAGAVARAQIHKTVVEGLIAFERAKRELGGVDITPKKAKKPEIAGRLRQEGEKLLAFSQEIKKVAQATSKDLGANGVKEYLGRSEAAGTLGKALVGMTETTTINKAIGKVAGAYIDTSIKNVSANGPDSRKVGYENIVALRFLGAPSVEKALSSRQAKITKMKADLDRPEIKAIVGEVKVEEEIKQVLDGQSKAAA